MLVATSNTADNSNNNDSSYFDTAMTTTTTTTNNTLSSSSNDMLTTTTQPHNNHYYHSNNNPPSLTTSSTNTTTTASGNPSPSSLPPTYATLPRTTKLEEEPNPFEQSFSKPLLPPVSSIESPSLHKTTLWDSLRAGPLSPSMLLGPAGNKQRTSTSSSLSSTSSISSSSSAREGIISNHHNNTGFVKYNNHHQQQAVTVNRAQHQSPSVKRMHTEPTPASIHLRHQNDDNDADDYGNDFERPGIKRRTQSSTTPLTSCNLMDEEEKRKNFLERNRLAALKCRQRKKQWLQNLQDKVEYLSTDNEQLQIQNNTLREQLIELKSMLLVHKTCSVNSEAVIDAVNRPIPGSNNIIRHHHHHQQQQQRYHHSTSSIHFSSNGSHRFSSYSRD